MPDAEVELIYVFDDDIWTLEKVRGLLQELDAPERYLTKLLQEQVRGDSSLMGSYQVTRIRLGSLEIGLLMAMGVLATALSVLFTTVISHVRDYGAKQREASARAATAEADAEFTRGLQGIVLEALRRELDEPDLQETEGNLSRAVGSVVDQVRYRRLSRVELRAIESNEEQGHERA